MLSKEIKNPDQETVIGKAILELPYFYDNVFSISVKEKHGEYKSGEHVHNMGQVLQNERKTMRISAKDHFKSMSLYGYVMWEILRMPFMGGIEGHYFSYKQKAAAYHIKKIKELISINPFYEDLIDLKPNADSKIEYIWNIDTENPEKYELQPEGLLGFGRGIHADRIFVDDPFQDPKNRLNLTVINTINETFKSVVLDLPHIEDGELHVVGTPQTRHDFFFDEELQDQFKVMKLPAIRSWDKKKVLWKEHMDFELLKERKDARGDRIFSREYMCTPVWSEDSFFDEEDIREISTEEGIKIHNEIEDKMIEDTNVVAGWDIGRKNHPSHFVVFLEKQQEYTQIHQKWMDEWPLSTDAGGQLEYIKKAIKNLKIDKVYYDATRGELQGLKDRGELPAQLEGVVFTEKKKNAMATTFEKLVNNDKIALIDNLRQMNQILAVTNDLQAQESPEGHGDSFWSISLAVNWKAPIRTYTKKPKGF